MVVAERHAHDAVPDADARRLGRDPREEHLRRAHVRVPLEGVVLDGPDPVEAHPLTEHGLLDAVPDHPLLAVTGRVGELGLEDHRELHGRPLRSFGDIPNRYTSDGHMARGMLGSVTDRTRLPTTSYAVLGLLSFRGAMSRYDLKKWSDFSLRFFCWSPATSNIYGELKRLRSLGDAPAP